MTWVESVSASFVARHDSEDADDAHRVLDSLERCRERLARIMPRTVAELTVVLHRSTVSLALANPLVPVAWMVTAPAARRYVAGWAGRAELHLLSPSVLAARASAVPGSGQMLALAPAALYARRVIAENNPALPATVTPGRVRQELRWLWLLEGGARWFSGQSDHARPAIARRLREGTRPAFPPGVRDAPLLGGTVIDLLVREEGEPAAARFVTRFHPDGPRTALAKAFGGRSIVHTEGAWRSHLARIAGQA